MKTNKTELYMFKEKLLRMHSWEEIVNTKFPFNFFLDKPEDDDLHFSYNRPLRTFFKKYTEYEKLKLDLSNPIQEYTDNFGYDLNKYGFRCNEFESINNPRIIVYGCSHTYGTGLPEEHTWPVIVKELLRIKTGIEYDVINFGVPGAGPDEIHRLVNFLPNFVTPNSMIFALMPPGIRKQFVSIGKTNLTNCSLQGNTPELIQVLRFIDGDSFNYEKILVSKTIKSICDALRVPVKILDFEGISMTYTKDCEFEHNNWLHKDTISMLEDKQIPLTKNARDLNHCGTKMHINIAQKMLDSE
jgi:hypothetical protein